MKDLGFCAYYVEISEFDFSLDTLFMTLNYSLGKDVIRLYYRRFIKSLLHN